MFSQQIDLFAASELIPTAICEELKAFRFEEKQTTVEKRDGIDFFFNEFWTAKQRQANRLHEISYRACFKPQLPEFFISRLTRSGDVVYDPFMGRGTTPVQAALMGRVALGNDANPLSAILTRPRLSPPRLDLVAQRLAHIDWAFPKPLDDKLLVFFHRETLAQIQALRRYLTTRQASGSLDIIDEWIRMVAVNRLTGHSPGFFSVYTMPPNQAVSIEAQQKINAKRAQTPPKRDVPSIILKKSRSLLSEPREIPALDHALFTGTAADTPEIGSGTVDLVVTSPPFLDIVQYAADNWLRCWFVGVDADEISISMHRDPRDWTLFIRDVFVELARVVRAGGHIAFEVGEVRNGSIELERLVFQAIAGLPFEILCVLVNVQEFTKTANCWGV